MAYLAIWLKSDPWSVPFFIVAIRGSGETLLEVISLWTLIYGYSWITLDNERKCYGIFGFQTKMEFNYEALGHVLESLGISELETKRKLILDTLREYIGKLPKHKTEEWNRQFDLWKQSSPGGDLLSDARKATLKLLRWSRIWF